MRDEKGQFIQGNPGKPKGSLNKQSEYKNALNEAMSIEDIHDIVTELKQKAKDGCIQSIKLLLEYTLGKPSQMIINQNYDHSESKPFDFNEMIRKLRTGEDATD